MNLNDYVCYHDKTLGDDNRHSLVDFIRGLLKNDELCTLQLRHLQFCMPASAYVFAFATLSLENVSSNGTVYFERSFNLFLQSLVKKQGFMEKTKQKRMKSW